MNGMPHLMCQCKYTLQIILLVQKHIWMCAICRPRICTASFVLILIYIDPSVVEPFFEDRNVFFSHRCKCFDHCLFCFFIGIFLFDIFYQRHIKIIHVQMLHTKDLLSKCHIPMHGRKMSVYCLYQIVIYRLRNISIAQMHSTHTRILAHFCIKALLFQITDKNGRNRISPFCIRVVDRTEHFFSKTAILIIHKFNEISMCNCNPVTFYITNRREFNIRIIEHRIDILRAYGNLPDLCKNIFFCSR